ncbi:AbrB/MazE/SpoVT family DNA-binding domain-containing protein [Trinickia diaoshuihuensis]|jgi:antitoxin MazE|uniref:AbrB/MazE/SpoVT family DNA-binding domain-containing protein n=1 Tax=Trinickia diaoshuihuensis TaxID=2292265 RepID=UPI001F084022|nr:AbrB/MazE/SpoVT family DNA-binding domain-containing protein [Trinickia diaoshuihuensis]
MNAVSTCRYIRYDPKPGDAIRCGALRVEAPFATVHSWGITMAVQTLKRWGNSLAVRIPASIAQEAHLAEGQAIDVLVVDGKVQIVPCVSIKRFSRERYMQQLREGKLEPHADIDFGGAHGSEFGGPDEPR